MRVRVLVLGLLALVACDGRAYLRQSCLYVEQLIDGCVADGGDVVECRASLPRKLRDAPARCEVRQNQLSLEGQNTRAALTALDGG